MAARKRPRRARFSFRRSEGYVRNSRFSANVQDADDVFVGTGFIAANYDSLFRIELYQVFQQFVQLRPRSECRRFTTTVPSVFTFTTTSPTGAVFSFAADSFRHFYVELVFVSGRVPGQEKENQERAARTSTSGASWMPG